MPMSTWIQIILDTVTMHHSIDATLHIWATKEDMGKVTADLFKTMYVENGLMLHPDASIIGT
jgi:hypothetical protein